MIPSTHDLCNKEKHEKRDVGRDATLMPEATVARADDCESRQKGGRNLEVPETSPFARIADDRGRDWPYCACIHPGWTTGKSLPFGAAGSSRIGFVGLLGWFD